MYRKQILDNVFFVSYKFVELEIDKIENRLNFHFLIILDLC